MVKNKTISYESPSINVKVTVAQRMFCVSPVSTSGTQSFTEGNSYSEDDFDF